MRSGEWILPGDYTPEDIEYLSVASTAGPQYEHTPLETLFQQHMDGDVQFLRLNSPSSGVVIVQVFAGAYGDKRLVIQHIAGTNTIRAYPEIVADMLDFARENGCEAVETSVYDTRLAKVLSRLGAKPQSITMVMEVPHGSEKE